MIPEELLKALGLLSVRFNELEDRLAYHATQLAASAEAQIMFRFITKQNFAFKMEMVRWWHEKLVRVRPALKDKRHCARARGNAFEGTATHSCCLPGF